MAKNPDPTLLDLLYQAMNAEFGIVVTTNNLEGLRQKLYAARKSDPDLSCLSFTTSRTHPETELLLVKKDAKTSQG